MKFESKIKAVKLRKNGLSYPKIREIVNVSKSTLSLWLRDIELTEIQQKKMLIGREKSRYAAGVKKKMIRNLRIQEIYNKSRREIKTLIKNQLFLVGLALYWAEGTKHSNERVTFSNSDPAMIELMMKWFRDICKIPEEKFRIQVHIHNLHCQPEIERYWCKTTNIPLRQFYKTYIKNSSLGQRRNILYNGTCSITVNSHDFFRKIMGWKLGLQEYFNISS